MPIVPGNGLDIHYRITATATRRAARQRVGDDLEVGDAGRPLVEAGLRGRLRQPRGGRRRSPDRTRPDMAADTKALADALGLSGFTWSESRWG